MSRAASRLRTRGVTSKANQFVWQDILDVIREVEPVIREDERRRIEEEQC